MRIPKHPTLIRSLCQARVKKLNATCPVLAASLVIIRKQCGGAIGAIAAARGETSTPATTSPTRRKGKTRAVYVPLDLVEEVKGWIEEHRRLKRLTQEITQLAIAQVRTHVKARNRRAAKS